MAGAAPQGGGGQSDNSAGILWGIAAIFAAIGIVWYAFKVYIVYGYLYVKLYEVKMLAIFFNFHESYFSDLQSAILAAIANPNNVTFNDMLFIGSAVGSWMRVPFALFLAVLAVVVYLANTTREFKRTYSIEDLAKYERKNWPQISPVIGLNLIKADIDKGPWAMAMTPMQFCKRFQLLDEVHVHRTEGMSRKDWDKIEVVLRRGEANKLFALQLGPLWAGTKNLPPHTRALFAVFAARINADPKGAAKVISDLSLSAQSKLDVSSADELLKKHENSKLVQKVVQSHAYVLTVMAAMLQAAREDGVQASADFLWLKPLDRRLWYTLNTVGRQTPFVEVAGIFAHWVAEKEAGRKLKVPLVEEATKALELSLKETVYRRDEEK
jgi:intracellular multiplication protein IcmP